MVTGREKERESVCWWFTNGDHLQCAAKRVRLDEAVAGAMSTDQSQGESLDFPRSTPSSSISRKHSDDAMADDMDVMAMMGITGFGKQTKKRELDPRRFEKNRRAEVP